ncbi:6991_t:CDS:1, partial [Funneliformis mosseae]
DNETSETRSFSSQIAYLFCEKAKVVLYINSLSTYLTVQVKDIFPFTSLSHVYNSISIEPQNIPSCASLNLLHLGNPSKVSDFQRLVLQSL